MRPSDWSTTSRWPIRRPYSRGACGPEQLRELRDEPRRAEQRGAILGLGSESRVLGSARSRKLNRFSDSARLGREAKTAARMRLGRDEPRRAPSALGSFAGLHQTLPKHSMLNSCQKKKWRLAILEEIRHQVMSWFASRWHRKDLTLSGIVSKVATQVQTFINDQARRYRYLSSTNDRFEIKSSYKR